MYTDEDLLPLSALQHIQYCERQCALIHIEKVWVENHLTAEGRVLHDRVDGGGHETRGNVRTAFSLRLRSLRLGLTGQADVVEFNKSPEGTWSPFPVEYKRGHIKVNDCDRVQLCAQALCLEEMLSCHIQVGALFYGETRRRCEVVFDEALRQQTETVCHRLHELMKAGLTPPAVYDKANAPIARCLNSASLRASAKNAPHNAGSRANSKTSAQMTQRSPWGT